MKPVSRIYNNENLHYKDGTMQEKQRLDIVVLCRDTDYLGNFEK